MRFLRQRASVRRLVLYQQHFSIWGEKTATIRAFLRCSKPPASKAAINRWLPSSRVTGRSSSIPSKMIIPVGRKVGANIRNLFDEFIWFRVFELPYTSGHIQGPEVAAGDFSPVCAGENAYLL